MAEVASNTVSYDGEKGEVDLQSAQSDLLALARKRYASAMTFEDENWKEAADDLGFAAGVGQWTEAAKAARGKNRPCLTVNKIPQYTRQVTGDMRLNRIAIKVSPVDDKTDPRLAKVMQGLIRNIEVVSKAQIAYVQAGKNAVQCGMGAFRVATEYVSDDSFEQQITIKRIANPFAVVWDPGAQELCREDANWCFVVQKMPLADFKAAFPDATISDFENYKEQTQWYGTDGWVNSETVRIAEYWVKKPKLKTIALMPGGSTVDVTDMPPETIKTLGAQRFRQVLGYEICQYLINGAEILDGPNPWLGQYIPIVPVWGEEVHLGDRTYRHGLIRFSKDPQRMYNYHLSQATETTALSPRAPVAMTPAQVKGYEKYWQGLNSQPFPYVLYNHDPNAPGAPQRIEPPAYDIANLNMAAKASEDMQSTFGIYNASLAAPSPETSGKAINARDRQADVGTFEYIDNLSYSIAHCGRILVDLIPKIYDTERVVRIIGEDEDTETVKINEMIQDPTTLEWHKVSDLSAGRYDVVVETGPSFSTKRQEAVESMMEFMRVAPQAGQLIVDVIAKNMNWPGAEQIANRLKNALPPNVDDKPEEEGGPPREPPPPPPQAIKDMAQADKTKAETEGVHLDNAKKGLELQMASMLASPQMAMMIQQTVQTQLAQILGGGGGGAPPAPAPMGPEGAPPV